MRKYKAVIIDFKKITRVGATLVLAGAVAFAALHTVGRDLSGRGKAPAEIISDTIPAAERTSSDVPAKERISRVLRQAAQLVLGFVPGDGESVLCGAIPVYSAVADGELISIVREAEERGSKPIRVDVDSSAAAQAANIPEENRAPIKSIDAAQKPSNGMPAAIGNETSYGVDMREMLSSAPAIDMSGGGPKVLITHTHATEAYAPDGAEVYDVKASDRDEDKTRNVVAVGAKMAEVFESRGIETAHDEILHDAPSFNGSYAHSLASVTEYMEKYPSIQVVFDIHRDSIVYDDDTKAKVVTEINGERTAQLMFVVGTDANGLYNPNWRSNMKSALCFQKAITDKYPKLMRHINLRRERFNGHTSGASMIIEVGTSGNSLAEAERGIVLAAECIADYLNSL